MNLFSVTGFENKCSVMLTLGILEARYSDLAVILSLEMPRLVIGGKRFIKWFSFASLLSRVIGAVLSSDETVGWQVCMVFRVDSGILSVISCTVKDMCIMGLCERIVNVVISSCKIMFFLTDFQVLHFCWSLVSAKNTFEVYLWSS